MIPKYNEMYNEILCIIGENNEIHLRELVEIISNKLNLTIEERNETLKSGKRTVIYDRVAWAKTYLSKAGLVENISKGCYKLTEEGKKVSVTQEKITNKWLEKYPGFCEFIRPSSNAGEDDGNTDADSMTPEESIDNAVKIINKDIKAELLDIINKKDWKYFEILVLELLEKMGYAFDKNSVISTPLTNDGGIDGIIEEDRLGFNNIYVQAKKWKGTPVQAPEIQKFLGAVAGQGGNKGLFITTSSFTGGAMEFAKKQLNVKLVLIDGDKLTDLMLQYGLGVTVKEKYEIKQIDLNYFED